MLKKCSSLRTDTVCVCVLACVRKVQTVLARELPATFREEGVCVLDTTDITYKLWSHNFVLFNLKISDTHSYHFCINN